MAKTIKLITTRIKSLAATYGRYIREDDQLGELDFETGKVTW